MTRRTTVAAVLIQPGAFEMDEVALTDLSPDSAVLRVEASGICGTDIGQFRGTRPNQQLPMILGHEPIGVIDEIGSDASTRWGVQAGDRVLLEAVIPCLHC